MSKSGVINMMFEKSNSSSAFGNTSMEATCRGIKTEVGQVTHSIKRLEGETLDSRRS